FVQSDPARYGDVEQRIRPLLGALLHERAQQMVEARSQLHDIGLPGYPPQAETVAPDADIESATVPNEPERQAPCRQSRIGNGHGGKTMKLFMAVYNDMRLLEPFLKHYANAGITEFYIATAPEFSSTVKEYAHRYQILLFEDLDVADSIIGG